ncbi:MAG: ABC transporter permease subunit [Spirochaetaceae bacterium]|jgi:putative aldouronate transport system permease protein|nr:ABC transporter permease subunit [Spirochaetaceae bacterium]
MNKRILEKKKGKQPWGLYLKDSYDLYLMLLPALVFIVIFAYAPMYGILMAFQDYLPTKGIAGSPFVGLKHFTRFLGAYSSRRVIFNTIILSFYQIIISFPFPIILALMINYSINKKLGKVVQTVTYIPHFISVMVLVGMMNIFFSPNYGIVNVFIQRFFGGDSVPFMSGENYFRHMYAWSSVWQGTGFGAIIYFSALSGVDPTLYEVATLDGAGKLQKIWNIDLPTIRPTCVIMLILSCGGLMSVGFDKAFLMKNSRNSAVADIISTYVYQVGILDQRYSFSVAIGLFNSIINFALLCIVNSISKKVSETALW